MTKPDFLGGNNWDYEWKADCDADDLICSPILGDKVIDIYKKDDGYLIWNKTPEVDETTASILAHIIPSRSGALGQAAETGESSVISSSIALNYGKSNQGHSAQFYDSYLNREGYWGRVLEEFGFQVEQ